MMKTKASDSAWKRFLHWKPDQKDAFPLLANFCQVYLAYGAEAVHRTEDRLPCDTNMQTFTNKLQPNQKELFCCNQFKRCMFSFLIDTTTMELASRTKQLEHGKDILYTSLVSHLVLNSPKMIRGFNAPWRLDKPLIANEADEYSFVTKWHNIQGTPHESKLSVPRAMVESVTSFICNFRPSTARDKGCLKRDIPRCIRELGSGITLDVMWENLNAMVLSDDLPEERAERIHRWMCTWKTWGGSECTSSPSKRGLPPFASYVAIRFTSIFHPDIFDWSCLFLGQYARQGLLELIGLSTEDAKIIAANPKSKKKSKEIFVSLLQMLPAALKLCEYGNELLKTLESLHLSPLAAVTIEHMLCEYRKISSLRSIFKIQNNEWQRTDVNYYRELWQKVKPIYHNHEMNMTRPTN